MGCFTDFVNGKRDLPNMLSTNMALTPEICMSTCRESGYTYAGLQNG